MAITDARDSANNADAPAAGWYRDPHVPFQLRWWNGDDWSTNVYMPERNPQPKLEDLVPELAPQVGGKWEFPRELARG
jgi:Protein of unknown function (DUF2510)